MHFIDIKAIAGAAAAAVVAFKRFSENVDGKKMKNGYKRIKK